MIGASYSTFDGLSLLSSSILSIRNVVDCVVVVHQTQDFYGNFEEQTNRKILDDLLSKKLIDKLFVINPSKMLKEEGMIAKRNIGLNYLKSVGVDFVITMDADEFYEESEILYVTEKMVKEKIDTCYSKIITYYGDQFHFYDDVYYVPSIYRIQNNSNYGNFPTSLICDPLRRMFEGKYILSDNVKMHHLSYIRESLQLKYRSSLARGSSKINNNMNVVCDYITKWKHGDPALVFDASGDLIKMELKDSTKRWVYE